jgi:uncharacterized membrane protein required for colicin V production
MIGGISWADLVIGAVLLFTTYRGFARGLVRELAGIAALAAGLIAPWYYNGTLDGSIAAVTKAAAPVAHVIGMVLSGVIAYGLIAIAGAMLGRIRKVPVLGTGDALAGAALGLAKGAILIWLVLFVALFFPLTPPIRQSLDASRLAPYFTTFDETIDRNIENAIPPFVLPWIQPLFQRHRL